MPGGGTAERLTHALLHFGLGEFGVPAGNHGGLEPPREMPQRLGDDETLLHRESAQRVELGAGGFRTHESQSEGMT